MKSDNNNIQISSSSSSNSNTLCVVCSTRNRALVLVPCGHFNVCVQCGHGLLLCPTCETNIKALLRVYD